MDCECLQNIRVRLAPRAASSSLALIIVREAILTLLFRLRGFDPLTITLNHLELEPGARYSDGPSPKQRVASQDGFDVPSHAQMLGVTR
jgi:hypothetical protein